MQGHEILTLTGRLVCAQKRGKQQSKVVDIWVSGSLSSEPHVWIWATWSRITRTFRRQKGSSMEMALHLDPMCGAGLVAQGVVTLKGMRAENWTVTQKRVSM